MRTGASRLAGSHPISTRALPRLLLGLIAQDLALFSRPEVRADLTVIPLQGLVFAIAVSLLLLARKAEREGWIRVS